jgi:hypothetical protein
LVNTGVTAGAVPPLFWAGVKLLLMRVKVTDSDIIALNPN